MKNISKKAKTNASGTQRPPNTVEEKAVPLVKRADRERAGNGVEQARPSTTYRKRMNVKGTGKVATVSKEKNKVEKEVSGEPDVITLDEDSEVDEVSPPDAQAVLRSVKPNSSPNPRDEFCVSTKANGVSRHRPSSKRPAIPSQTESVESVSAPGDETSPRVPVANNVLPAPPPLKGDYGISRIGISTGQHWEATGYAIMSAETTDSATAERHSVSPLKSKQNPGFPPSSTGQRSHSHIIYSLTPVSFDTARSRLKELSGNPLPEPDNSIGRPEWIDEPPPVDQSDIGLFRQVPPHLRIPFVAFADELDMMDEPSQNPDLSMMYLDFRGWSSQGVPTHDGGPNIDLDMQHVMAAQKVWRSFRSAQILREEASGRVFKFTRVSSPLGQETQREPSGRQVDAMPMDHGPIPASINHVASVTGSAATSCSNGKPEVHTLPNTPKQRPPTEIVKSPEIVVQPAPAKLVERIDGFDSPGKGKARAQAHDDDIESPLEGARAERDEMSSLSEEEITCMN